jgi:hypothetical protein
LRVHIADHAYKCGSTIFGMKLIITSAGIQVVAFTLVVPAKFINAERAAGAADWYLVVQYKDRFIETNTLLACSVI